MIELQPGHVARELFLLAITWQPIKMRKSRGFGCRLKVPNRNAHGTQMFLQRQAAAGRTTGPHIMFNSIQYESKLEST